MSDWTDPSAHDDAICAQEHYEMWACINGNVYGPCSSENCYGACDLDGKCSCRCHREGGKSVADLGVEASTARLMAKRTNADDLSASRSEADRITLGPDSSS